MSFRFSSKQLACLRDDASELVERARNHEADIEALAASIQSAVRHAEGRCRIRGACLSISSGTSWTRSCSGASRPQPERDSCLCTLANITIPHVDCSDG
jgi:hypothetical protein